MGIMNPVAAAFDQSAPDRGALSRMVTRAFEHWKLGTEEQLAMLGQATNNGYPQCGIRRAVAR